MNWIVSKSVARNGGWHVQVRTDDQLSSFAVIATDPHILRTKTPDGQSDVFTLTDPKTMATMNVIGKIEYRGFDEN